jgi:hypothetical protein
MISLSGHSPGVDHAFPTGRCTSNSDIAQGVVSLRDILEEQATELQIDFSPRQGLKEKGKPVYQLGSSLVFWSDDALYYRCKSSGNWIETSVDALIALETTGY